MTEPEPVLVVVAGPNGSGKSTFFDAYLADLGLPYVNADRVAQKLRDADPKAPAERIDRRAFTTAEALRRAFVAARLSFCTETVFSDPVGAKLKILAKARARGFVVFLVFIGIEGPELSVARVQQRVAQGGHDVPDEKLQARFPRTLANLRAALAIVDEAFLFDNSSADDPYRVVAVYAGGKVVSQHGPLPAWTRGLPGLAREARRRR
ncbi:MAG: zeta toxin family protein [Candidatus Rokubacteria bacterium]|nr:zeta toxin family protein [Candidatus Rokubacteria bacterium]